jgi:hypothetical protein
LRVVEGHLGEEVVADVCVGDVVQSAVHQPAEGAVHRAEGASQPSPAEGRVSKDMDWARVRGKDRAILCCGSAACTRLCAGGT